MSLITDIRAVSENAIEQLAARFSGLPRPLLAAIGAGDMAVERLADLRESIADSIGDRVSAPSIDVTDVRSAASDLGARVSDLPSKAQKVASDVAGSIEQFAAEAPAKAQELIAQLPDKLAEFQAAAQSLSPDAVRETVEAYTQLVGMIYGNLADRGDKTWTKVRATGVLPGAVVEAARAKARPATAAARPATEAPKTPSAAAKPAAAAPKPAAAPRSRAPKPAPSVATTSAPTKSAAKSVAKPAAAASSAAKPAAMRSVAKAVAKPATKAAPQPRVRKTPAVGATKPAAVEATSTDS